MPFRASKNSRATIPRSVRPFSAFSLISVYSCPLVVSLFPGTKTAPNCTFSSTFVLRPHCKSTTCDPELHHGGTAGTEDVTLYSLTALRTHSDTIRHFGAD